jgi:hypothetical protein
MTGKRAFWIARALMIAAIPALLVGCGGVLVGSWKASTPAKDAQFHIRSVKFKDDGTYTASARKDGKDVKLGGSYEFNGFQLKLTGRGKKPGQQYDAMVNSFTKTLELTKDGKKQTLQKQ